MEPNYQDDLLDTNCGENSDLLHFEFKDHPEEDGSNLFPEDPCDKQIKQIFANR